MQSVTSNNAAGVSSGPPSGASPDIGNVRDEFRALTSTCGAYDLTTRAKLEITGNDRIRFLSLHLVNGIDERHRLPAS